MSELNEMNEVNQMHDMSLWDAEWGGVGGGGGGCAEGLACLKCRTPYVGRPGCRGSSVRRGYTPTILLFLFFRSVPEVCKTEES